MISKEEKLELLADARDNKRRADFDRLKKHKEDKAPSLDNYLKFLSEFQKVFSFRQVNKRNILAGFNKL